jgi:hypothetical protein
MKFLAGSFLAVLRLIILWLGRESAWTTTLPAYRELDPLELTPEITKVGDRWPLENDASLWFRPGETSYATVLKTDEDRVFVKLGTGDTMWLERDQIRGSFMRKPQ